jgi:hypothetical protein
MPVNDLPQILETKRSLDGGRKEFRCGLLERGPAHAVVLFISPRPYQVADVSLPAGTVTFGHFWTDRAYNVYHWLSPEGRTLGFYFNVADGTTLDAEGGLQWRDLAVDVLVAGGVAQVLDEHELPRDLTPDLRAYVDAAKRDLLARAGSLTKAIEADADQLWRRAFGAARP